jgi:hypothetical protein
VRERKKEPKTNQLMREFANDEQQMSTLGKNLCAQVAIFVGIFATNGRLSQRQPPQAEKVHFSTSSGKYVRLLSKLCNSFCSQKILLLCSFCSRRLSCRRQLTEKTATAFWRRRRSTRRKFGGERIVHGALYIVVRRRMYVDVLLTYVSNVCDRDCVF